MELDKDDKVPVTHEEELISENGETLKITMVEKV